MKAFARVNEGAKLRRLAAHVLLQAMGDVRKPNPLDAVESFLWLTGPDFPIWAEVAGIPFADPISILTRGHRIVTTVRGRR